MVYRFARAPLAAVIVALAAAAPLGAQGGSSWQGIVTYHLASEAEGGNMSYYEGPGIARMDVTHSDQQAIIIIDPAHSTTTIIMPSRQMYMTNPMKDMMADAQKRMSTTKLTNTGKTEVVAGHTCTYYHAVDTESNEESDVCIATDMGTFVTFQSPMGGGGPSLWQRMLGTKGGFFPLKVISHKDGKDNVVMEATKIEAKSLDPSLFVPPPSYKKMDMGGMGSGTH